MNELDQLVVGLGHRVVQFLAAVGIPDEHLVAAVDVDVLHVGVVEQRLQPTDAEQGRVDRRRCPLLLVGSRWRAPLADLGAGMVFEHLDDQRPGVLPLVFHGHRRTAGDLIAAPLLIEPVGHLCPQPANQHLVGELGHRCRSASRRRRRSSARPKRAGSAGVA